MYDTVQLYAWIKSDQKAVADHCSMSPLRDCTVVHTATTACTRGLWLLAAATHFANFNKRASFSKFSRRARSPPVLCNVLESQTAAHKALLSVWRVCSKVTLHFESNAWCLAVNVWFGVCACVLCGALCSIIVVKSLYRVLLKLLTSTQHSSCWCYSCVLAV
jgi:hypothetical protein